MSNTAWILLVGLGVLAGAVVLLTVTRRNGVPLPNGGDAQGSLVQIKNDETWTVLRDAKGRISSMQTTRIVTPTLIASRIS